MTDNMIGANILSCSGGVKGPRELSGGEKEVIALPREELTSVPDDKVGKQMEKLNKLAMNLKTKADAAYCGPDLSCGCNPDM
jgi:hypothetical protein